MEMVMKMRNSEVNSSVRCEYSITALIIPIIQPATISDIAMITELGIFAS